MAIAGSVPSNALVIRENTQLAKVKEAKKESKDKSKAISLAGKRLRHKKKFKLKKERVPKVTPNIIRSALIFPMFQLNSAGALAAVFKAGAINDQMKAVHGSNEEATLASQEQVSIRGNDARHMLMHKLMRTNRSTVMVLKNMVGINEVDDELEEEIRDECTKYGTVTDVVIVKETSLEEVRIFVRFADPTQAESAVDVFDGRYFDGKTVKAEIYDQILFEHEEFTA